MHGRKYYQEDNFASNLWIYSHLFTFILLTIETLQPLSYQDSDGEQGFTNSTFG